MKTYFNKFRKMPGGYSPVIVIPGTAAGFPDHPSQPTLGVVPNIVTDGKFSNQRVRPKDRCNDSLRKEL